LGASAEKAIEIAKSKKRYTDTICVELPPEINKLYCGPGCCWTEFCKLRVEGAAE
jgi:hypothetical protein